jgi:hypothetical protein
MFKLNIASCVALAVGFAACSPSPREDATGSSVAELANADKDVQGHFPYVVEVIGTKACTGTVIGCRHVLTAAHCFCESVSVGDNKSVADPTTCALSARVRFQQTSRSQRMPLKGVAVIHPSYREERDGEGNVVTNQSDLAVVKLEGKAPDWARNGPGLAKVRPDNGASITMVGYGALNASARRGDPVRQCVSFRHDDKRRWGTARVGDEPSIFPGFFYIEKASDDPDSSLLLEGDSGGPALQNEIVGVASIGHCTAQRPARQATIAGFSWYTVLDVVDGLTKRTHYSWISNQISDCSGEVSCSDGLKNGDEAGVDCGGTTCTPCCSPIEACGNGIDDDCDGAVDCEDTDCAASCSGPSPRNQPIAVKWYHACALASGGSVRCWGINSAGELGDGTTTDRAMPVTVLGISNAVSVTAGFERTCAVLSDGTIQCWGSNFMGQLGNGTTEDSAVPVTVSGITNAIGIATGDGTDVAGDGSGKAPGHTCALLSTGSVQCWGQNVSGELGDDTTTDSSVPVSVSDITTAVAVAAGYQHSCAALADGTVRCWGANWYGELGNGTTTDSSVPVTVSDITNAVGVAAGGLNSCALLRDGSVKCWGYNGNGELGNGTTTDSSVPVPVSGITTGVAVAVGGGHVCAMLSDGAIRCWGSNYIGQLGNNGGLEPSPLPLLVYGIATATGVAAGEMETCATLSDGSVQCWGLLCYGELCSGAMTDSPVPVPVDGF